MSSAAQQYLAFVMFPDRVSVVLWQSSEGKIRILSQSAVIEAVTGKDDDISRAIDTALDELGPDALSVKGALFVVSPDWIEDGDLTSRKKTFLKSLTHDLMLEPMGYVVLSDTLLAHEAQQSPKPFTGLVVYDSAREWIIEAVKAGSITDTQRVGKSQELSADMLEFSSRLQSLGSAKRALLIPLDPTSRTSTEETLEASVGTSIEQITAEQFLKIAVTVGGAEILQAGTTNETEESSSETVPTESAELIPVDEFTPVEFSDTADTEEAAEEQPTAWNIEPHDSSRVSEVSPAGFVIHRSTADEQQEDPALEEEFSQDEARPRKRTARLKLPKLGVPAFLRGGANSKQKRLLLGVGGAVLALLLISGGTYAFLSQRYTATATVWLQPQSIEESFVFVAGAPSASSSAEALPLPGEIITETATVEIEVPATGSKITGDPASGRVVIFNKTTQSRTFAAGTQLKTGERVYVLSEEVTIPAATTQDNTGTVVTTSGTAEVAAQAAEIGPEGNLGQDTKFTVANFDTSSYEAQAKTAFENGSKREIQAVSQLDIDQAAQQLRRSAEEQIQTTLEQQQQSGNTIFPSDQITVTNVTAAPQVDQEAKFVTVSLTAESNALRLTADQTSQEGVRLLTSKVQGEQELLADTVTFSAKDVSVSSNGETFTLNATVTGQAVERLMADDLKNKILGVYTARAETVLSEHRGVSREEITVQPGWARFFFPSVPKDPDRVHMNIKLDREL